MAVMSGRREWPIRPISSGIGDPRGHLAPPASSRLASRRSLPARNRSRFGAPFAGRSALRSTDARGRIEPTEDHQRLTGAFFVGGVSRMDIASVFDWFARETVRAAEETNDLSQRERFLKLAML